MIKAGDKIFCKKINCSGQILKNHLLVKFIVELHSFLTNETILYKTKNDFKK